MTGYFKALAKREEKFPPDIIVAIFNVQDEGNLVFDVSNSIGTFDLCRRNRHDREKKRLKVRKKILRNEKEKREAQGIKMVLDR